MFRAIKFSWLLLITGAVLLGNSVYLTAKAQLAQVLIERTWQQRIKQELPAKPWPWADTSAVAVLEFPSRNLKRFVMKDASGESLAFGPGMVTPAQLPATMNHSIIAGHRDSHFEFLRNVQLGEKFIARNYQGQSKRFKVVEIRILNSEQEPLIQHDASGLISLVTCFPFNEISPNTPLRLLVNAVADDDL